MNTVGIIVIAFVLLCLVLALPRLLGQWLVSLAGAPGKTIAATLYLIIFVGTGIGIYLHIVCYKDKTGWTEGIKRILTAAQTGVGMSRGSAWFDLTCMFIFPAIILLAVIALAITGIVRNRLENKAAIERTKYQKTIPLAPAPNTQVQEASTLKKIDLPLKVSDSGQVVIDTQAMAQQDATITEARRKIEEAKQNLSASDDATRHVLDSLDRDLHGDRIQALQAAKILKTLNL